MSKNKATRIRVTKLSGVYRIWGTSTSPEVFYQVNGIEVVMMTSDPTAQYNAIVNISVVVTSDV